MSAAGTQSIGGLPAASLRSLKRLPGTLVIVPVVVLLFGSAWTLERRLEPPFAELQRSEGPEDARRVPSYLVPEGAQLEQGIVLAEGDSLTWALPPIRSEFALELQAFYRDAYVLFASSNGETFSRLWNVPRGGQRGMQTRRHDFPPPEAPITHLRLTPRGADGEHRVAGLRVTYTSAVIRHLWLIPALWGGWLLVSAACRSTRLRPLGERLLAAWARADVWLATALSAAVLFRLTPEVLVVGATIAALALSVGLFSRYFARSPLITVVYVLFLYLLFFVALPYAITRVVAARAGSVYDFTIDHRMRPDGREINSDGIRFRGEPADLRPEDFVILQLGDSFTYGLELEYEESYPYVMERLLGELGCSPPVRVVNFGWASSSPLLSLRLLRQVGAGYQPDLIVYNLDMTDFADDLRYENELNAAGDLEVDHRTVARELLLALSARLPALAGLPEAWAGLGRSEAPESVGGAPVDRFFATARALEETRADIERGVVKNLADIHRHAERELGARMALVIAPRAYQYSGRESPRNWEKHRYEPLGPHVLEPFRYFEEVGDQLPYPVFSLLPDFQRSERFPLFLEDDPHWNRDGARLVAEAVSSRLVEAELVPCGAD